MREGCTHQLASSVPIIVNVFILGLFSSLSPCFFPLFPSFLAYVVDVESNLRKGIFAGLACIFGITLSFTLYGILTAYLFSLLVRYGTLLRSLFGIIIIILGVLMYLNKVHIFVRLPQRLFSFKGYLGAFMLGLTYTLIAAPCALPIFLSAILIATVPGDVFLTVVNLLGFTLGVAIPFMASPFLVMAAKKHFEQKYQAFAKWFNLVSSSVLVVTGLLLLLPTFGFPSIF